MAADTKPEAPRRDVVVIGGSAGAIAVLRELLSRIPRDFPAAIIVVVHIAPQSPALLARILAQAGALPADTAWNGMPLKGGRIVVAPPDHHLLVEDHVLRLTHGPRENKHRPSVDVLFRSAAVALGPRVVGVVLSGGLDDGAAGLWAIKRRGGLAIVQDPQSAEYAEMPRNAIEATQVDYVLTVAEIADKLKELAREPAAREAKAAPHTMAHEARMAADTDPDIGELDGVGARTPYTCPECGGALWELSDTGAPRFRCHVGHAYSMHTFASEQSLRVEAALWAALRSLEEQERLAHRMAGEAGRRGSEQSERYHRENATTSAAHAEVLRDVLTAMAGQPGEPSPGKPSPGPSEARQRKPKRRT